MARTPIRLVVSAFIAVLALVVASIAPGNAGTDPSETPASASSFATSVNPACTAGRRYQALVREAGPFCAPPDSIRAIDDPGFLDASVASALADTEPVLVLDLGDAPARGYPIRVLTRHEIVNDVIGSRTVAVTFCPLCGSGVAFDRQVNGRTLTFAVSGRLVNGNLVMFDRETESFWEQITGTSSRGPLEGSDLEILPLRTMSFEAFLSAHPDGLVMDVEGGLGGYVDDPYAGYARHPERPSPYQFGSDADPRLPPKWRVLGIAGDGRATAVPFPRGRGGPQVLRVRFNGATYAAIFTYGGGVPSTGRTYAHQRLGWNGVIFSTWTDGRRLSLDVVDGRLIDRRTGSRFDAAGAGISGPLRGARLTPVPAIETMWFSWAAFHPTTSVVGP